MSAAQTLDPHASASPTADREISFSREFDAPRELVFDAFVDPRHVSSWWGPRGFVTTTHEMDVRPGGVWRHTMRGPDGTDYPNYIVYTEVSRPERLAWDHGTAPGEPVAFQATATFEDVGDGRTRVTMRSVFPTAAARDYVVREHDAIEGGKQTLARLAEHLASRGS